MNKRIQLIVDVMDYDDVSHVLSVRCTKHSIINNGSN